MQLMSLYSPDVIYYDAVLPLQFTGLDEVRRNFLRWFDEYDGPIGLDRDIPSPAVLGARNGAATLPLTGVGANTGFYAICGLLKSDDHPTTAMRTRRCATSSWCP
jgi:hypothetical protein